MSNSIIRKRIIAMTLGVLLMILAMGTLIACGKKDAGIPYSAIMANNDDTANGAVAAMEGNANKIPIYGIDASTKGQQNVNDGKQAGTVEQQQKLMAQALVDIIVEWSNNKEQNNYGNDTFLAYKNTQFYAEKNSGKDFSDKDVEVGDAAYNYKGKDGVVRIPYKPYVPAGTRNIESKEVEKGPNLTNKALKVVFYVYGADDWMTSVQEAVIDYAKDVELTMEAANFNIGDKTESSQATTITSTIGNYDIAIINPAGDGGATQNLKKIADEAKSGAGVPVIFNNKQSTSGEGYDYATNKTVYVGSDLDGGGDMQGTMLANDLKKGGRFAIQKEDNSAVKIRVLVLGGEIGHPDAIYRTFTWIIAAERELKDTGIEIVFEKGVNSKDVKWVQNYGGSDPWSSEGAKLAVEQAKTSPGIKLIEEFNK